MAFGVWAMESLRVWFVAQSLNAGITVEMAIFVALLSALLTTLPFTPAGLGVVEVAIVTALTFVSVSSDVAAAVAVVDRLITYWSVILVGGIAALLLLRSRRRQEARVNVQRGPAQSLS
jgi:uncharacterized protein (TIRG00374 family)